MSEKNAVIKARARALAHACGAATVGSMATLDRPLVSKAPQYWLSGARTSHQRIVPSREEDAKLSLTGDMRSETTLQQT